MLVKLHGRRDKIGSVVIPDCFARQPESGDVIARGPRAPVELQPGTVVVFGKYNGFRIESPSHDADAEYYVMEADHTQPAPHCPDVYGVIDASNGEDVTLAVSSDRPKRGKRAG